MHKNLPVCCPLGLSPLGLVLQDKLFFSNEGKGPGAWRRARQWLPLVWGDWEHLMRGGESVEGVPVGFPD